ncbi:MAG: hypothetical protein OXF08_05105 [Bacteroidetes bacterium]|nr:hypothetical protein [Bacteroidota bacterium]
MGGIIMNLKRRQRDLCHIGPLTMTCIRLDLLTTVYPSRGIIVDQQKLSAAVTFQGYEIGADLEIYSLVMNLLYTSIDLCLINNLVMLLGVDSSQQTAYQFTDHSLNIRLQ